MDRETDEQKRQQLPGQSQQMVLHGNDLQPLPHHGRMDQIEQSVVPAPINQDQEAAWPLLQSVPDGIQDFQLPSDLQDILDENLFYSNSGKIDGFQVKETQCDSWNVPDNAGHTNTRQPLSAFGAGQSWNTPQYASSDDALQEESDDSNDAQNQQETSNHSGELNPAKTQRMTDSGVGIADASTSSALWAENMPGTAPGGYQQPEERRPEQMDTAAQPILTASGRYTGFQAAFFAYLRKQMGTCDPTFWTQHQVAINQVPPSDKQKMNPGVETARSPQRTHMMSITF